MEARDFGEIAEDATVGKLTIDSTGTGTLAVCQAQDTLNTTGAIIGLVGSGSFTQTGGTNSFGVNLALGSTSSGNGTYALNGGSLSGSSVDVGLSGADGHRG